MVWLKRSFMARNIMILGMAFICLDVGDCRAEFSKEMGSLQDAKNHTREEFVHGMATMTLAVLQDHKKSFPERKVLLRQCFNAVVDIDWIAKFVLGRPWTYASDVQRERYTELYHIFLTESYVSNFAENPEQRIKDIKILGIQDGQDNSFIVNTNMMLANMDEVRVDYRVSDHEGKYKVIDIIIENVSLLATHRSEFGGLAASQGINGVITRLEAITGSHEVAAIDFPKQ
jgi:phospholipid transport system substrate-binding protein